MRVWKSPLLGKPKFILLRWLRWYFSNFVSSGLFTNVSESSLVPVLGIIHLPFTHLYHSGFVHSFKNWRQMTWDSNDSYQSCPLIKVYETRHRCFWWLVCFEVLSCFSWVLRDFLFLSFSSNNWLLILSSWPRNLSLKNSNLPWCKIATILGPWTLQIKTHVLPP